MAGMVKLLAVGDLHLRKTAPSMRKDDFQAALERKVDYIFALAKEHDVDGIVFPGDVFDRHDAPHGMVEWAVRKFSRTTTELFFVYGQHDLRYHTSDKQNSPLGVVLAALDKAHLLEPDDPWFIGSKEGGDGLALYGCSWGEELSIETLEKMRHTTDWCSILVMHRPITLEPLPWNHDLMLTGEDLLHKYPNVCVFITGDNHKFFTYTDLGRSVLNMGSVCRQTVDQIDHTPSVALVSFAHHQHTVEIHRIPIVGDVFNVEVARAKKEQETRVVAFVDGLRSEFDPELSFKENLRLASESTSEGVRNIISEVMEK